MGFCVLYTKLDAEFARDNLISSYDVTGTRGSPEDVAVIRYVLGLVFLPDADEPKDFKINEAGAPHPASIETIMSAWCCSMATVQMTAHPRGSRSQ